MKTTLLLIVLFPTIVWTQDFGFFGKKNVLSFNINGAAPLVYNNFSRAKEHSYIEKNGDFVRSRSYLNYGFRLGLTHYFSGKFGIGMEVCYDKGKINGPKDLAFIVHDPALYSGGNKQFNIVHERMNIQTVSFLPKLEYTLRNAELPVGMSYEFGIGVTMTKAIAKDYFFKVEPNQKNSDSLFQVAKAGLSSLDLKPYPKSLIGLTIFYGINFKTPISRNILLHYGLRYTLNPTFSNHIGGSDLPKKYMHEIEDEILDKRAYSLIQIHVGINYVF